MVVFFTCRCSRPHRSHESYQGGLLANLLMWASLRPTDGNIENLVEAAVRPRFTGSVVTDDGTDIDHISGTLCQWPAREDAADEETPPGAQAIQEPVRPTMSMVLHAGPEHAEMQRSTFQRPVVNGEGGPLQAARGDCISEWQ